MRKNLIANIILSIIAIVAFVFFINWKMRKTFSEADELHRKLSKEYPSLSIDDSLFELVTNIHPIIGRNNPDYMRLTCSKDKKYCIDAKYCIKSEDINLEDVLNIGDSIKKAPGSDTLVVINRSGQFLFKLKIGE